MSIAISYLRLTGFLPQKWRLGCEGGAAAEFALIIPLLLFLIIGIFEFGRLYWIQNTLQYAAEQTGRCVMANPALTSVTSGTCALSDNLAGITANTPTTGTVICSLGTCRWIEVTYTFSFNGALAGLMKSTPPSITLTGRSEVPID